MSTSTAFAPPTEELAIASGNDWAQKNNWPPPGKWTYQDYQRLPDDGWIYEVIEGELYMSPPPIPIHQENSGNLFVAFHNFVKKHKAGVREYWIVDPLARTIELFIVQEDRFALIGKYGVGETVRSEILSGFEVKVDDVCPEQTLEA